MTITYAIAEEFSKTPGGRFRKHGPFSGEEFREDVLCGLLRDAMTSENRLVVVLDGTAGYGSSFLEEAFGGLIRLGHFDRETLERHLEIRALDALYETYRLSANKYIARAKRSQ